MLQRQLSFSNNVQLGRKARESFESGRAALALARVVVVEGVGKIRPKYRYSSDEGVVAPFEKGNS